MKTCFSKGKTDETIWEAPLSKRPPPPLFLSNFFMTTLFVQILKTRTSSPLILGGRKLCRSRDDPFLGVYGILHISIKNIFKLFLQISLKQFVFYESLLV